MKYVSGKLLQNDEFVKGYVGFEDGINKEIGKGNIKNPIAKGLIIPGFFNSHTHIGDSIAKDLEIDNSVKEVMKPPNGLKHKILNSTPSEELIKNMKKTIIDMFNRGITNYCDFRENGLKGILNLKEANKDLPINSFCFSRPRSLKYSKNEIDELLKKSEGIGISGISDWEYSELVKVSKHVKKKGKKFAFHASEDKRENIDNILDLQPDFLIHMTKASDSDLEIVADNKIPIVICPRANVFFGEIPNIPRMLKYGIKLNLGTDNVMINKPDMFTEMEFAYKISRLNGFVSSKDILKMATFPKILNLRNEVEVGKLANFQVLKINTENPFKEIVNNLDSSKISIMVAGKYVWRRGK